MHHQHHAFPSLIPAFPAEHQPAIHIHIASEQQNRPQRQRVVTMAWFNRTPQEPFFGCSQFPSKHAWATHLPVLPRLMLRIKPRSVGSWRGRPVQALAGRGLPSIFYLQFQSFRAMLRTRSRYGAAEEPAAAEPGSWARVLTTQCWCPRSVWTMNPNHPQPDLHQPPEQPSTVNRHPSRASNGPTARSKSTNLHTTRASG